MERDKEFNTLFHAMQSFCDYRERCESEVITKFKSLSDNEDMMLKVLDELKEFGFYDDERYLEAFIRGKHQIKKWGRMKIRIALLQKKIDPIMIDRAMDEYFSEEAYEAQIEELFIKKWGQLGKSTNVASKQKIYRYLYSKGYESPKIYSLFNKYFS